MRALPDELDLREALRTVASTGAAFVPQALDELFLGILQRELEGGPFERLPEETGPVRQEAELFMLSGELSSWPAMADLRRQFARLVRRHGRGVEGIAMWWPNEIYVQRYHPGALGISAHLDSKRFACLVAAFTTKGAAELAICESREGQILEEWTAAPGSLVLLRGPGLGGVEDGRPFHLMKGPTEGLRYSLTFRMNFERVLLPGDEED